MTVSVVVYAVVMCRLRALLRCFVVSSRPDNASGEDGANGSFGPAKPDGTTLPVNLGESVGLVGLSGFLRCGRRSKDQLVGQMPIPVVGGPMGSVELHEFSADALRSTTLTKSLNRHLQSWMLTWMVVLATDGPMALHILFA